MKKLAFFSAALLLVTAFVFLSKDSIADTASMTIYSPTGTNVPTSGNVFSWSAVLGSDIKYTVLIDNNSNFASPEIQRSNLSATSFEQGLGEVLSSSTLYHFKVEARESGSPSIVDQVQSTFTTQ